MEHKEQYKKVFYEFINTSKDCLEELTSPLIIKELFDLSNKYEDIIMSVTRKLLIENVSFLWPLPLTVEYSNFAKLDHSLYSDQIELNVKDGSIYL